ncbi:MAG TPA: NFACT RNA binding domain-containing protein [Candidatus Pacearchaeota archaeon]|jgi:predicted ribosome quality control (RQC) complex YloA/Tae2 family protein|nr:NFACT RNA binding domain-containing protein [Candidatus Pacearchaeota archaeon]|tara:strand:+ start:293 stop:889 length:597 start_codon:yes stop_codon:yes gene_type:complete
MFKKLRQIREAKEYMSYRWFFTSEGKLVVGGKSDEQNENVLRYFKRPGYTIMHTTKPGSPFMIIQSDDPSKNDLDECAVFCACFSKEWKTGKKSIDIDVFKGGDVFKNKGMKTGTFGVKNKKKVKAKPELMVIIQKGKIRAVPKVKGKEESLAVIKQGKMDKEAAAEKIAKKIKEKYLLPVSREEVMRAIPSGNMDVR